MKSLRDLKIGESGIITAVGGEGQLRRHFLDMGLIPGSRVKLEKFAPMGDPMELETHGYSLTLRLADAEHIKIRDLTENDQVEDTKKLSEQDFFEHPGLGEAGIRYHDAKEAKAVQSKLVFALAGNQNCGKTTLFNQLTGSNQHVGNFPGVTVDRKSGTIKGNLNTELVDLPGIYSLSPYTAEEIVSRQFIIDEKPSAIINIVDATNIERNLILTTQLMELNRPMVLAINMMDELTGNGGSIDINAMETLLGIPVVPISAAKDEGVDELAAHAIHVAEYQEYEGRTDFCQVDDAGGAVHRCIHGIIHLIDDHAKAAGIPTRFAATKLVEGDQSIEDALNLEQNEKEMIEHIICQMEEERGLDRVAAIADMRLSFIEKLCANAVKKPTASKEKLRSEKIDKILTGKWTAIPSFIAIIGIVFYLTFNVIGAALQQLLASGISALTNVVDAAFTAWEVDQSLHSLIIDGIFTGVGSVLSFVPIVVTLFFFLSILEDSGYMARVAFVADKLLRKIGLSGRSIVPMILGFGCSVPAVMSSRTLPSERDRKMTIMMIPFMSCSAKLPIYAFFTAAFFPGKGALVMICLYLLSFVVGILLVLFAKATSYHGEAVPFVMELPNYRLPGVRNVAQLLWEKTKDFLQKAFTIILVASVVVWFLKSFNFHLNFVEDSSESILAIISGFIAPIFAPLGLGTWQFPVAFISGFLAKESVVSMLQVLFEGNLVNIIDTAAAASALVFSLLYTPCVAAIAAVKRELGARWAILMMIFQCIIAWVVAFIVHLVL